jgi:ATP-dependent exoDNAse (exonuclease V) beta subunit
VHAILAAVDLRAPNVRAIATNHARLVAASPEELAAAIAAVEAALAHPLLVRAAAAPELRREVPVALATPADGMIEGIVDLAFAEAGAWRIVDYKTDAELGDERAAYEAQVRLYARAIAAATGKPAVPILLLV